MKAARPPVARIASTTAAPCTVFVPCTTTAAPRRAKCCAMPFPIPEVEPVTIAMRPVSDGTSVSLSWNQDALDHAPFVHAVERILPLIEPRAKADQQVGA